MFKIFQNYYNQFYKLIDTDRVTIELMDFVRPEIGSPPSSREIIDKISQFQSQNLAINFYEKIYRRCFAKKYCIIYFLSLRPEVMEFLLDQPIFTQSNHHDPEILFDILLSYCGTDLDGKKWSAPEVPNVFAKLKILLKNIYVENNSQTISEKELEVYYSNSEKDIKRRFNYFFEDFPASELWRLFYDGEKQKAELGWVDYEKREPGFLQSITSSFIILKNTINDPLTLDIILKLHYACVSNISILTSNGIEPGKFRDNCEIRFGIEYGFNFTLLGLYEILSNIDELGENVFRTHICTSMHFLALPQDKIINKVNLLLKDYKLAIENVSNIYDKLLIIINLISHLARLHPFEDGNCRTFCTMLLMRELLRSGFSPTILFNPNRFDGFSQNELISEVVEGMKIFSEVKNGNTSSLGKDTEEILDKISTSRQENYTNIWHEATNKLVQAGIGNSARKRKGLLI